MKIAKLIAGLVLIVAAAAGLLLKADPRACVTLGVLGGVLVDPADVGDYLRRIRGGNGGDPTPPRG